MWVISIIKKHSMKLYTKVLTCVLYSTSWTYIVVLASLFARIDILFDQG